jgi:hypothetical protein
MHFEILGEISGIETFAAGSAIREIARLRRVYGRGRWRKRKGIAQVRLPMALSTSLKYTGTKPPASVARNSRSSTCFEEARSNGETESKTPGRMHRQRRLSGVTRDAKNLRRVARCRGGKARACTDHRRIRGRLSLSWNIVPFDRATASCQEGDSSGSLRRAPKYVGVSRKSQPGSAP